jgi:UDPglucose 6-dehydrogenase
VIVCVLGLWHLGSVTAACLAAAGHRVIGLDFDPVTVATLAGGDAPVAEPGLDALLREHAGQLAFTSDPAAAAAADVLWVTYDTPVDAEDRADVEFVITQISQVLPHLRAGTVVIVSSQLPVGSTARLARLRPDVHFAASPRESPPRQGARGVPRARPRGGRRARRRCARDDHRAARTDHHAHRMDEHSNPPR